MIAQLLSVVSWLLKAVKRLYRFSQIERLSWTSSPRWLDCCNRDCSAGCRHHAVHEVHRDPASWKLRRPPFVKSQLPQSSFGRYLLLQPKYIFLNRLLVVSKRILMLMRLRHLWMLKSVFFRYNGYVRETRPRLNRDWSRLLGKLGDQSCPSELPVHFHQMAF